MRIIICTESRADWGGLLPVVKVAVEKGHDCIVWIIGEHLERGSAHQVRRDIVDICEHATDSPIDKADIIVLLGDREALLPVAVDAWKANVLIAHLSGGDKQLGRHVDEPVRHSLSKFAHIHFPCTTRSKQRLIDQGEDHKRIFLAGSTMVDGLVGFVPEKRDYLQYILVQMHPARNYQEHLRLLLASLDPTFDIKIMKPNSDTGFGEIPTLRHYEYIDNLPRDEFLQLIWNSKFFAGNSSALFLEAQYLGVPCLHVGERNKSREESFPGHIIHRYPVSDYLVDAAVELESKNFRTQTGLRENWREGAHGDGTAAEHIVKVLEVAMKDRHNFWEKNWP